MTRHDKDIRGSGTDFDWAIAPVSRETFFSEYFEKKHLVVKREDPGYYGDLLTFADIDRVVSTMGLYAPEITVTKNTEGATDSDAAPATDRDAAPATDSDAPSDTDAGHGQPAPPMGAQDYTFDSGYVDPVRVAQLFADGGTVILSALHERLPQLARFCRALEAALSTRVQTNIYMTPGGNRGFRPHYDSHDVLVLQIEGTKEWRIYDTPVELPLHSQAFNPADIPVGEETDRFVLEPGDMAYVPRGLAHDAVATDETSLHITTGLMFRTWADIVVEAAQLMAHKDPAFRRALPPGYAAPGYDFGAHEAQFRDLLARLVESAPYEGLMRNAADDFIATRLPRVEGQLSQIARLGELTVESEVGARPDLVYDLTVLDGADGKDPVVSLSAHGSEITLPVHAEEPLSFAVSTPHFRVRELPGRLDDDSKLVLVRRLIREGLVRAL